MSDAGHPFLWGRHVLPIIPLVVLAELAAYRFWRSAIGDDPGIVFIELFPALAVVIGSCLITPKMATWEATGVRRPQVLAGATATLLVAVAASTPLTVYAAISTLPPALIPNGRTAAIDEIGVAAWLPIVTNLMTLAGIALAAVATLGRTIGALVAIASHACLFWLNAGTVTAVPYSALSPTKTEHPTWVVSSILLITAAAIWYRTGGSTGLGRRLDPRHQG